MEYSNPEKCAACGGKCCLIYLSCEEGGTMPTMVWFEEWCCGFHEHSDRYGVKPLFDPLEVFMSGNEHMLKELKTKGINPYACNYLGPNGCIIPWPNRPTICKEYRCNKWEESPSKQEAPYAETSV